MKGNKICIKKTHIFLSILAVSVFAIVMALRSVSNTSTAYKSRASDTKANLLVECASRIGEPCCTNQSGKSYCDKNQKLTCYKKDKSTVSKCISEDSVLMEDNYSLYKDGQYPPNKITGFLPGTNGFPCLMKDNTANKGWNGSSFNGMYIGVCVEQGSQCVNLSELEINKRDTSNLQPWLNNLPLDKNLASPFDATYNNASAQGGVCVKRVCGSENEEACYDDGKPYCKGNWLVTRYIDTGDERSYLGCVDNQSKPFEIKIIQNNDYLTPFDANPSSGDLARNRYNFESGKPYKLQLTSFTPQKPYRWEINCDVGERRNNPTSKTFSSPERTLMVDDITAVCSLKPGLVRMRISLLIELAEYRQEILIDIPN